MLGVILATQNCSGLRDQAHPRWPTRGLILAHRAGRAARLILQRDGPDNEHNEGANEPKELVKPVQGAPIQQLVEDVGNEPADNREYEAPREPSRGEFASTLQRVADGNCDQSSAPCKTSGSLNRPWRSRRYPHIAERQPGQAHDDDPPTRAPLAPVSSHRRFMTLPQHRRIPSGALIILHPWW